MAEGRLAPRSQSSSPNPGQGRGQVLELSHPMGHATRAKHTFNPFFTPILLNKNLTEFVPRYSPY